MAHALLSASGSKRWLSCPPSARLEQQFPDQTSEYAEEGTFAHALAELKLGRAVANSIKPSIFKKKLSEMQKESLYSVGMEEYIEQYATHVFERFSEAKKNCPDALILLEQRLDFSEWVPDGFGTGDVVIIADNILEIIDLKYGKGVPVSAIDNPQIRLYGLGCISNYSMLYDFSKVRMTIIQPRLDSISSEEMTVEELLQWAEEYVKPRAKQAMAGEGELSSGDYCQFCKARCTCRARASANLEMAKYDFQDPFLLSIDEIAEILAKADELQKWSKDIQEYALEQAVNHGVKFTGWKLVEGRSNRKYTDEKEVKSVLITAGYEDEKIHKPKELLGITAMEDLIGKKNFQAILNGLVIKPSGKPVLVPESDKRQEISSTASAVEDFKEE